MTQLPLRLASILVCVIGSISVLAQSSRNYHLYRNTPALGIVKLSVGTGISYYMGDMRAKTDLRFIQPHIAATITYRLTERFSLRGEVDFYRISGKQKGGPIWYNNLSFRSDNPAGYLGLQVDLFRYHDEQVVNPYLLGGIGITRINPKAQYDGTWHSLAPLQTEGIAYKRNVRIGVIGIGTSWKYNERWNFSIELSNNYTNSDYLDDVSTIHHDASMFSDPILSMEFGVKSHRYETPIESPKFLF